MSPRLDAQVRHALRQVADAAQRELDHGAGCRTVNKPLTVSNVGLARRFDRMTDAAVLHHLRHAEADVAFLVFYGLHDVLTNADPRLRALTGELLRDAVPKFGPATAAALRAIEHYDRERLADQRRLAHRNRITQFL